MDCRRAGQAIRLLSIRVHCQLRVKYHYINLDIRCESVKFAHVKYLYMVNVELVYAIFLSIPICRRSMLIFSLFVFDKLWHKHINESTIYLKKFSVCQMGNNMLVKYRFPHYHFIKPYVEEESYNAIQYKWIQLNTVVFYAWPFKW